MAEALCDRLQDLGQKPEVPEDTPEGGQLGLQAGCLVLVGLGSFLQLGQPLLGLLQLPHRLAG